MRSAQGTGRGLSKRCIDINLAFGKEWRASRLTILSSLRESRVRVLLGAVDLGGLDPRVPGLLGDALGCRGVRREADGERQLRTFESS